MITNELLNANETLATLNEEQKSAIVNLSKQDEDIVIGERIKKVYSDLDNDILSSSGIERGNDEKTYAYAKRVIGTLKGNSDKLTALQGEVDALAKTKAELEAAIANGSADTETKRQLTQAKTDLADITKKYTDLNTRFEGLQAEHERELFGMRVSMELETASAGVKFKNTIPESVRKVVLNEVTERIKKSASTIEDGDKKTLVFTGQDGAVLRDNNLLPLKASDLLYAELDKLGVVDKRKVQTGAGSKQQEPEGGEGINLTGAKTQVEAVELIHKSLASRGLINGTKAYQQELDKAWKENGLSKLPIK